MWRTWRLLHRYTYGSVIGCLPPHHLYLAFFPMLSLPYFPPTDPSVWCSLPCVHVFSLFNTHLWVRTCGVWFSVLVSVCWEWWFPGSPMSLQRCELIVCDGCIIFHSVYVPHFPCPVYHWWAFGLVPGLCYCKLCCNEHSCVCVLIVEWFIILWIYTQ